MKTENEILAYVDDSDSDLLSSDWYLHSHGYITKALTLNGRRNQIYMHRVIMSRVLGRDIDSREKVDHIDGNPANNSRSNLRLANNSQNGGNSRARNGEYKGVSKSWKDGIYRARIKVNFKEIHIGTFDSQEEAARAYDTKARELFGEFARLNFPND